MKTTFISKDTGVLTYKTSTYEEQTIEFPADSIQDWYPFDLNYTYRYSVPHKRFFLVLLELEAETKRYNVHSNRDRSISNTAVFRPTDWYCPEVKIENAKVIQYAKDLGLKTIEDDLTYSQVCATIRILGDKEQELFRNLEDDVFDRLKSEPSYDKLLSTFLKMGNEDRYSFILNKISQEDKEKLKAFGQMYCMYGIMRKMAKHRK